jgi:multiple sugar transport system permease protein
LGYVLSFGVAWVLNELRPKIRAFMTVIFYAPSISGNVFFIWGWFFSGDRYGWVNGQLLRFGLIDGPINFFRDPTYILPILIGVQLWLSLGVGFLAFIAGLQTVDKSLYEAGAVDGVRNRWQELWFITLPSMKPQLMFGAVMQITGSFAVAEIVTNLAGMPTINYSADTIITHLQDVGWIRFEMGYASAIATILFLMMVGSNKAVQRLLRRVGT